MFGGVSKTPVLKGAASKGHKNSGSERQPGSSDKTQNTIKGTKIYFSVKSLIVTVAFIFIFITVSISNRFHRVF